MNREFCELVKLTIQRVVSFCLSDRRDSWNLELWLWRGVLVFYGLGLVCGWWLVVSGWWFGELARHPLIII